MTSVMMSNGLLILLTLLAVRASGQPALMLSLGGALMISVTAGYVRDGGEKLLKAAQLFLAVLFAFFSGTDLGCLVFACILWTGTATQILMADGALLIRFLILMMAGAYGGMQEATGLQGVMGTQSVMGLRGAMGLQEVLRSAGFGHSLALFLVRLFLIDAVCALMGLVRYALHKSACRREEERQRLRNFHLSELQEIRRNKELVMQSFYAEKNARLTERENISRNIHNSVGHSITAAIMTLDAADMLFDKKPEEAHKKMNDAAERIRGSLGAIRSAVRALDEEAEDVSVKDLICYFDNILDEFLMDTERSCERHYEIYDPEMILPREHAEFLTGALEELLTNSVKHGGAMHFSVRLSGDNAHVRLDVKDDGKSDFDENTREQLIKKGFGLKKLTSYANKCGGQTDFRNEGGFAAMIELPIR